MNNGQHEERRKFDDPNYTGVDRRRARRIRGILVGFRMLGSQEEFQGIFLRDMSSKGVSFTATQKLAVGNAVEMNIYLTDTKNPTLAQGKVRWVEDSEFFPSGNKAHYDAGVEITQISDDDLKALEKYMKLHEGDQ